MNLTSTSRAQNNSSFFTTLRELFKKFYGSPNIGMRKRGEKYSGGRMTGRVKILRQLTYRGYVLHQWVCGIERERERERGIQSAGHRKSRRWDDRARTHTSTHTHLIYLHQRAPVLLFPLYTSDALSLLRFSSRSLSCVVPFNNSIFPYCCFSFFFLD